MTSRLRGNLSIFGNKNLDVHIEEKGVKSDQDYYFHATCALLEDFENFVHFDHISYLILTYLYFFALFDPS